MNFVTPLFKLIFRGTPMQLMDQGTVQISGMQLQIQQILSVKSLNHSKHSNEYVVIIVFISLRITLS